MERLYRDLLLRLTELDEEQLQRLVESALIEVQVDNAWSTLHQGKYIRTSVGLVEISMNHVQGFRIQDWNAISGRRPDSTDPDSTDPVSTDPESTDPDPDSTDPDSTKRDSQPDLFNIS